MKIEIYQIEGKVKPGLGYLVHHFQNIKIGNVTDTSNNENINWVIFHCGLCDMFQKLDIEIEKKQDGSISKRTFPNDIFAFINVLFFLVTGVIVMIERMKHVMLMK